MFKISLIYEGFFENKGSKFFSFLIPIALFDQKLSELRCSHPKAVHFVYATRKKETQIIESFSDDGEPKGSSGMPTLHVLRGEKLIDVGLVSVRYFGGTLLGVGGLVRAYTQSAQNAISEAKRQNGLKLYEERVRYQIVVPYSLFSQIQYWINYLKIEIVEQCFQSESVKIYLSSTEDKKSKLDKICNTKFGF